MRKGEKEKFLADFCVGETHATRETGLFGGDHPPRMEFGEFMIVKREQ